MEQLQSKAINLKDLDVKDFEEVFKSLYNPLCSYANKMLKSREDAEEIVQNLFVILWNNREKTSINIGLDVYLFSSLKNQCLNYIKSSKAKESINEKITPGFDLVNEETDCESIDLESRVLMAIESMPEKRKQIFIMSKMDGLKYQEIADKLSISIKTVEAQMGAALKHLRTNLGDLVVLAIILKIYKF